MQAPQRLKNGADVGPSNHTLGCRFRRTGRGTSTPVFPAASFLVARAWAQPQRPSADEHVTIMWNARARERSFSLRRMHVPTAGAARTDGPRGPDAD